MIRSELIKKLNKEEKKWLALAIATVILSENKLNEEGMKHLQDAWTFLESKEEIERLVAYIRRKSVPTLKPLKVEKRLGTMMLIYLIRTVASDAKITEYEYKKIDELALKLGIFGDLKEPILKWALDLAEINQKAFEFLDRAGKIDFSDEE